MRDGGAPRYPWMPVGGGVDVLVFASLSGDPASVERNATPVFLRANATSAFEAAFAVPVAPEVRTRGAPVVGHVFARPARAPVDENATDLAASAHHVGSVPLTRVARTAGRSSRPRKLLERAEDDGLDRGLLASHWKFGDWPLVLRALDVGGDGVLARSAARDGLPAIGVVLDVRGTRRGLEYMPPTFLDESLVIERHARPLDRNASRAPPVMRFSYAPAGPLAYGLRTMVATQLLRMASAMLPAAEVDDLRYQISDKRVFRYALTQAITVVHVVDRYSTLTDTSPRRYSAFWLSAPSLRYR